MSKNNSNKYLFIVASGSGGHILPALQLGKNWLQKNLSGKIVFFTGKKELDKSILTQQNYGLLNKIIYLNFQNLPGKKIWLYPFFIYSFFSSFFKTFYYAIKFRPEKIISTGGYTSIPACLACKLLFIKIELYELNVIPGKAIKFLSYFTKNIFITFNETKKYFNNPTLINYPIRFTAQDKIFDKNNLLKKLNLDKNKKIIFILGGSQGSIYLNNIIKKFLLIPNNGIQVIHQTGNLDKTDWENFYKNLNINAIVFSYTENIKDFYLISDLIISRAGAGTLFELEFFNKKSIIIPLKSNYTDHQYDNALAISKRNPENIFLLTQDDIEKDFSLFSKLIKKLF